MKLDFFKGISIKLILIHCLAGFLLIFAASLLGYINDIVLINLVEEKGVKETMKQIDLNRLTMFQIWFNLSPLFGILIGTIVSTVFFFKRKLVWLNSVFVFIVLYFTNYFGFISNYRKYIAFSLNFGLLINVIILSTILMILAISIYIYCFKFMKTMQENSK